MKIFIYISNRYVFSYVYYSFILTYVKISINLSFIVFPFFIILYLEILDFLKMLFQHYKVSNR